MNNQKMCWTSNNTVLQNNSTPLQDVSSAYSTTHSTTHSNKNRNTNNVIYCVKSSKCTKCKLNKCIHNVELPKDKPLLYHPPFGANGSSYNLRLQRTPDESWIANCGNGNYSNNIYDSQIVGTGCVGCNSGHQMSEYRSSATNGPL